MTDGAPSPEAIGRYRVLGAIGTGAMGSVVRARDERLGRDVAIKRIRNLHGVQAELFQQRFEAEARALAALAHPGIVQVFDLGVDGGEPYLVMELLAGPTLRAELTARGRLPAAEVAAIGIQLARALEAAHDRAILHRDIKPSNIVRAADGRWKLVDFGVAHVPSSDLTPSGQFVGTPAYAAPEALTLGRFSPASDIYGLAATLHELALGSPPRGDLSLPDLFKRVDQPVLSESSLARLGVLAPALSAALALDPAARPAAARLAELLARATDSVPTVAAPALPPLAPASLATVALTPSPTAAPSRARARAAIAAVVVIFLIGLLALLDRTSSNSPPARGPGPRPHGPPGPPLRFDAPPDLDDKGARDWTKIADKIRDNHLHDALRRIRDFERKHGSSAESSRLREWLESQPMPPRPDD
jgi:eukaryotic-like serine/threonine-protein kinase